MELHLAYTSSLGGQKGCLVNTLPKEKNCFAAKRKDKKLMETPILEVLGTLMGVVGKGANLQRQESTLF